MDKYIDNKLAEEMDLIVLTTDALTAIGLPKGTPGTLIESYTRHDKPLYGLFRQNGRRLEVPLGLRDFRVLNPRSSADISFIGDFLRGKKAI